MRFFSIEETEFNVGQLLRATSHLRIEGASTREKYLNALSATQKIPLTVRDEIVVSFDDGNGIRLLEQRGLFRRAELKLSRSLTESERASANRHITHAMLMLRALDQDLHRFVHLHTSEVACALAEGSGGGTASNLLGIIWLSPHPNWTTIDYAECLVHEAMHLNVFLGDMLYGIYNDPTKVREALVVSAIRKVPRAIDKSLHSACVAVALTYYYELLGDAETAASFHEPLQVCVASLAEKAPHHLTPYGQKIVEDLLRFVARPTFAALRRAFCRTSSRHLLAA